MQGWWTDAGRPGSVLAGRGVRAAIRELIGELLVAELRLVVEAVDLEIEGDVAGADPLDVRGARGPTLGRVDREVVRLGVDQVEDRAAGHVHSGDGDHAAVRIGGAEAGRDRRRARRPGLVLADLAL